MQILISLEFMKRQIDYFYVTSGFPQVAPCVVFFPMSMCSHRECKYIRSLQTQTFSFYKMHDPIEDVIPAA